MDDRIWKASQRRYTRSGLKKATESLSEAIGAAVYKSGTAQSQVSSQESLEPLEEVLKRVVCR